MLSIFLFQNIRYIPSVKQEYALDFIRVNSQYSRQDGGLSTFPSPSIKGHLVDYSHLQDKNDSMSVEIYQDLFLLVVQPCYKTIFLF